MRTISLVKHGPSARAFELREQPDLPVGPGQLRIQVDASGLNFADVMARLGLYPEAPPMPSVLGYEVVGKVLELGAGVNGFSVGDRVLAFTRFGGYASQVVAQAAVTVKLGDQLDAATATALGTQYCTAWFAAEEMVVLHPGDHVLIHAAAGGVGTALVQLAKRRGCKIFGTVGSAAKLEYLKELGVDHPINYRESDFSKEFLKLSGGRKADVVFDAVGGANMRKSFELLGAAGRVICYGAASLSGKRANLARSLKTLASFGFLHPLSLMTSSRAVIGVNLLRVADERPDIIGRCMREVVGLAEKGELQIRKARAFPVEQIAEAHEFLGLRHSTGKVAVVWS